MYGVWSGARDDFRTHQRRRIFAAMTAVHSNMPLVVVFTMLFSDHGMLSQLREWPACPQHALNCGEITQLLLKNDAKTVASKVVSDSSESWRSGQGVSSATSYTPHTVVVSVTAVSHVKVRPCSNPATSNNTTMERWSDGVTERWTVGGGRRWEGLTTRHHHQQPYERTRTNEQRTNERTNEQRTSKEPTTNTPTSVIGHRSLTHSLTHWLTHPPTPKLQTCRPAGRSNAAMISTIDISLYLCP